MSGLFDDIRREEEEERSDRHVHGRLSFRHKTQWMHNDVTSSIHAALTPAAPPPPLNLHKQTEVIISSTKPKGLLKVPIITVDFREGDVLSDEHG